MKKNIIIAIVIILTGIGIFFLTQSLLTKKDVTQNQNTPTQNEQTGQIQGAVDKSKSVIGTSVQGREVIAYHYGTGTTELLLIGGIHGGYEWNTSLVAYATMNYLKENPTVVPSNVKVTVIPVLNPDGLYKVVGTTTANFTEAHVSSSQDTVVSGRFNGNNVDLNRNFDCDWQADAKWQSKTVSGGSAAFSEPESQAVKNYVEMHNPKAVVVWYSAAGGVFASSCHNGVLPETRTLTTTYAKAAGYPAHESFDFYEITGDMVNWFAKNNIPAISVLLTTHEDVEWTKNQAGIKAVLEYYAK